MKKVSGLKVTDWTDKMSYTWDYKYACPSVKRHRY